MAVEMGEERISDQLVDQLKDVGVWVESASPAPAGRRCSVG